MGFIDNKFNVVNQIGVFKTLGDLPKSKQISSFGSVGSKSKNLLPFMMDMLSIACMDNARKQRQAKDSASGEPDKRSNFLKSVPDFRDIGRCEGKKILIEILIEFFPTLVRIIREGIIGGIRTSVSCSSDFLIPNPAPTVTVDIKTIDFGDMMKINPSSFGGSLMYGSNVNTDFNRFLYDTIQTPGVVRTWNGVNGPLMEVTFVNPKSVTLKVHNNYVGSSFNTFISDYVNSIEIMSQKTLTSNLLDNFFGNISSGLNIGLDINLDNERTNKIIDKILDTDPLDGVTYDNSFFEFTNDELAEIEIEAGNKTLGVRVIDLGCGLIETTIDDVVISGLTQLDVSTPTKIEDIIKTTIDNVTSSVSSFGDDKDGPSIGLNFGLNMIMSLPKTQVKMMMTPKVLVIHQLSNYIVNNRVSTDTTGSSFARNNKGFFQYLVRESFKALAIIIFNKLKTELVRLIRNVVIIIIKEQAKIYIKQLTSLVNGRVSSLTNRIKR